MLKSLVVQAVKQVPCTCLNNLTQSPNSWYKVWIQEGLLLMNLVTNGSSMERRMLSVLLGAGAMIYSTQVR